MCVATMKVANEGWTRVDVRKNEFATVAGPERSEGLVHLVVHCDLTRKDFGLTVCTVLDKLQMGWSNTTRLFIQLEFGSQSTCAADHVRFGSWVSSFVEAALDMHLSGPCRVFVGITDGNSPIWDVSKLISAPGTDKKWFTDSPAVMIMLYRGRAVDVGNNYGVGGQEDIRNTCEAGGQDLEADKVASDADCSTQQWLGHWRKDVMEKWRRESEE